MDNNKDFIKKSELNHPYLPCKLAHAYVPFQYLCIVYPPMKGLEEGTIFPELDSPYGKEPEYLLDK